MEFILREGENHARTSSIASFPSGAPLPGSGRSRGPLPLEQLRAHGPGRNLIPTALNNNGQVAGEFVDTSAHPNGGAFLWSQGTLTTLSVLGNNPLITGLNDSDQVVGDLHVTSAVYP